MAVRGVFAQLGSIDPGAFLVVTRTGGDLLEILYGGFAHDLGRHPHDQRARWELLSLRDNRASGDDRPGSDASAIEDDRPHPDQAVVLDLTAMEDRAVPGHDT